jgi:hypothetical protein
MECRMKDVYSPCLFLGSIIPFSNSPILQSLVLIDSHVNLRVKPQNNSLSFASSGRADLG